MNDKSPSVFTENGFVSCVGLQHTPREVINDLAMPAATRSAHRLRSLLKLFDVQRQASIPNVSIHISQTQ